MSAQRLIDLTLTRSSNPATDALLAAVGGPQAVNGWLRRAGIAGFRIDRDIATLVRDDGAVDPATTIDPRDSATPMAMVRLLTGLYQGQWLSRQSRDVLLERDGALRDRQAPHSAALLPEGAGGAQDRHAVTTPPATSASSRCPMAARLPLAIYVTGQGGKPDRDARIAEIARADLRWLSV